MRTISVFFLVASTFLYYSLDNSANNSFVSLSHKNVMLLILQLPIVGQFYIIKKDLEKNIICHGYFNLVIRNVFVQKGDCNELRRFYLVYRP